MQDILGIADIRAAAERIAPYVRRTPVLRCPELEAELGAEIHFKCENFQEMGAFKLRGATNAVLKLPGSAAKSGVATHSSGNHGTALALAAKRRGMPACVVMPENASAYKQRAVAAYGARIIRCEPNQAGREAALARYVATVLNGMAVQAASGASTAELRRVAKMVLNGWPPSING